MYSGNIDRIPYSIVIILILFDCVCEDIRCIKPSLSAGPTNDDFSLKTLIDAS